MLSSNRLIHSLVAECKGGRSLDSDQLRKYASLTVDAVRTKASLAESSRMSFSTMYACVSGNEEALLHAMDPVRRFPLLSFGTNEIGLSHRFDLEDLNNGFSSPLRFQGYPPLSFYPFSDSDPDSYIARFIFQDLVSAATQKGDRGPLEFDSEIMLSRIHPLWSYVDDAKKAALRHKVDSIISYYVKRDLKGYLERVKRRSSWKVVKSLQAFSREVRSILDDLTKQKRLDVGGGHEG